MEKVWLASTFWIGPSLHAFVPRIWMAVIVVPVIGPGGAISYKTVGVQTARRVTFPALRREMRWAKEVVPCLA